MPVLLATIRIDSRESGESLTQHCDAPLGFVCGRRSRAMVGIENAEHALRPDQRFIEIENGTICVCHGRKANDASSQPEGAAQRV
ncbi:hypothetical protein WI97_04620 [Burkholderia vietnamiensis]|nr:hypothetical protein WI97_04620 [Burkholderia vietnamiensis]